MSSDRQTRKPAVFVIKTADSKSFSNSRADKDVFRQINRHAQVSRREVLAQRQKPPKPQSLVPIGWLQRPSGGSEHDGQRVISRESQPDKSRRLPASASCIHSGNKATACPRCTLSNELVLWKSPSSTTIDPFGLLPIPMNAEKYSIMQYFAMRYLPAQLTFYEIAETAKTNIVKGCLSQEIHFYSLLAAATARMKHVTKDAFTRPDLPEYFALRATSMLRQHLLGRKPVTQQVIFDMFLLASAESYRQNWPGVNVHRTAFKHSVAALGGFSKLDRSICKMLWRGDLFVAAVTSTPPILELCWDPGPMTEPQASLCARTLAAAHVLPMGAGFLEDLAFSSNSALLKVIADVIGFASNMQYYWSGFTEVRWDRDWIWARSSALMHRLLSLETASSPRVADPSNQQDLLVEECSRLAIVIWLYFGFFLLGRDAPQRNTLRVVVRNSIDFSLIQKRLTRIMGLAGFVSTALESDNPKGPLLPRHCRLLLWILGLGVLAAVNKEDVRWLSRHFIAISRRLGLRNYEVFESTISSRYLWLRLLEEASGGQLTNLYDNARVKEEYPGLAESIALR